MNKDQKMMRSIASLKRLCKTLTVDVEKSKLEHEVLRKELEMLKLNQKRNETFEHSISSSDLFHDWRAAHDALDMEFNLSNISVRHSSITNSCQAELIDIETGLEPSRPFVLNVFNSKRNFNEMLDENMEKEVNFQQLIESGLKCEEAIIPEDDSEDYKDEIQLNFRNHNPRKNELLSPILNRTRKFLKKYN